MYQKEKKRLKALQNQDDITFADAMKVFRLYCLGEDRSVSAHVLCEKPDEGTKPVRGEIKLPKSIGNTASKSVVLVFAKGQLAEDAKSLGANIVGAEDLIAQVSVHLRILVVAGQVVFDKCLATKEMWPQVVKIARVLGPKGLMPSPARGTVSDDIATMMATLQATQGFELDTDSSINLGKIAGEVEIKQIKRNCTNIVARRKYLWSLVKAVVDARPAKTDASKFVTSINLWAPFAPAVQLPMKSFRDLLK
ncbi:hypothetical protein HDU97_003800 [Phlyctochytrium planicorne]|nr:hypothetical protein HDU97_003800 [Phlyctochytrium planicorne]